MMENNDFDKVFSIDEAIELLKSKNVLVSLTNTKNIYYEKNHQVFVISYNCTYLLNYSDFKKLYQDTSFYIYQEDDEKFDFSRDDEYYGWKRK